jgi:hypothetical protein
MASYFFDREKIHQFLVNLSLKVSKIKLNQKINFRVGIFEPTFFFEKLEVKKRKFSENLD